MEQAIKIAAKLYKCRDTAKTLAKMKEKDYHEVIRPYMEIIKQVMKDNNLDEIPALLAISKTKTYEESGMTQLLFMAAAVEIMEPSGGGG